MKRYAVVVVDPNAQPEQIYKKQTMGGNAGGNWVLFIATPAVLVFIGIVVCALSATLAPRKAPLVAGLPPTATAPPGLITFQVDLYPSATPPLANEVCTCVTLTPTPVPECWPYIEVMLTRVPEYFYTPTPSATVTLMPTGIISTQVRIP